MIMNNIKTACLLGALSGIFFLIGGLVGGQTGVFCALIMACFINGISYFFSDKIVLNIYKAERLDHMHYLYIYEMVQELVGTMRLPMPKLWLIKTEVANAFATGRNPHHASIALTTGIIKIMDSHELRAILAHELSHIKNRDILTSSIAATFAAAIGYCAHSIKHMLLWGHNARRERTTNIAVMIVLALCMPIIATLLQLALSRTREYLADETGAYACHDPLALAAALEKLDNHMQHAHFDTHDTRYTSTAHLFIANPFSTHPPIKERIKRLYRLYEKKF